MTKAAAWTWAARGGHSTNRIVHSGKDATGRRLVEGLGAILRQRTNITIHENGVSDRHSNRRKRRLRHCDMRARRPVPPLPHLQPRPARAASAACTATPQTPPPQRATESRRPAGRRSPEKNMEFVQFHPRPLPLPDVHGQYFLISEAVRGDGGLLYDVNGAAYHGRPASRSKTSRPRHCRARNLQAHAPDGQRQGVSGHQLQRAPTSSKTGSRPFTRPAWSGGSTLQKN